MLSTAKTSLVRWTSGTLLGLLSGLVLAQVTTGTGSIHERPAVPRKDAFFGVHFDLHPGATDTVLGRDATNANIGAFLDRVKPDFVQYDCKGHGGYTGYPTKVGYPSPGIVKDALALWREETFKRRIGLYIHYSGVWDSVAIERHPEWARIDEAGNRDPNSTSVFGPYASQLMIPQLKEVTSKYNLDGVWVDGDCWAARLDYGTTAALAWKDFSGTETLPRKPEEPNWQTWKTFHRQTFEDYLVNWVDELHKFNPELELCSNWAYTPHMPIPIRANVDFLSGDFSAKESVDRARFEARYLASSGMPWDLMAWGFNSYHGSGSPHQKKTAEQLMQEAAVVLALGGGVQVYYQPTRSGYVTRTITEIAGQVADFCRDRQAISHKSKTVPQVALLLSTKSYMERMDNVFSPSGQYNALEGALHGLLDSGYSVDLLSEHQLAPRLKEFPVVVLSQAPTLDKEFRGQLMDYVRGGGSLVLLDRESAGPFKGQLGIKFLDKPVTIEAFVGVGNATAVVPGAWQRVETSGSEVVAFRTDGDGETTSSGAATEAFGYVESARDVAATKMAVGKGTIVAAWGPVSQAYFDAHHPVLRDWIGNVIKAAFPHPQAKLEGAPNVDMSLRKLADGRTAVHLVNLNGAQRANRFAAVDHIPNNGPAKLVFEVPGSPKGFIMLPDKVQLNFEKSGALQGRSQYKIHLSNVPLHAVVAPGY